MDTIQQHVTHAKADLDMKIRDRLEWSDMKLLRSILVSLDTRNWAICGTPEHDNEHNQDYDTTEHIILATDYIISSFRSPLEAKGTCLLTFNDELEEIVLSEEDLSIQYEDYKKKQGTNFTLLLSKNGLVFFC